MNESGFNSQHFFPTIIQSAKDPSQEIRGRDESSGVAHPGRAPFEILNDNGPLEPFETFTPTTPSDTPHTWKTVSSEAVSEPQIDSHVDPHVTPPTDGRNFALYSPHESARDANIDAVKKSANSSVPLPFYSPPLDSNPSTPPISLPVTPPAISTVYGSIAMSMPGNTKSLNGDTYQRVDDVDSDVDNRNEYSRIEIPETQPDSDFTQRRRKDKDKFPSEKKKTLIALIWFIACLMITCLFITLAHDRYPEYKTNKPLPDIVLENVSVQEWAFPASEYCAMVLTIIWYSLVLLHRHKWILLRRHFFLMGLLYLYRCVTMYVTNLPRAYDTYECASRTNGTFEQVVQRSIRIMLSGGMSVADELHTCGDWVFSGHTCVLVTTFLFIQEYSPRRLWPLHWACGITSFIGVVFILLGHDHYTLDCVLAYYVCTRLFWVYHTMASCHPSKRSPTSRTDTNFQLNRVLWFRIFDYFESNVKDVVPRHYGWPLPWPRHWASKHKEFD